MRVALDAGIDVRMITGDHTVTARAIADQLELGPGVITGTELQQLSDDEVVERLPAAARVRPGRARGQGAAGPADAGGRRGRRDDRRRGQRRRRAQAGRHRRRHGQRLGGHQAGRRRSCSPTTTSPRSSRAVDLGRDIYRRITSYVKLQLTDPVVGAAADAPGDDLQHQRRRGAVPDAAAVLQVLRRRHRRHRVHRRRPRPERHAAAAAQAGHPDRQPARRSSAGWSAGSSSPVSRWRCSQWGPDEPSTDHAVGVDDDGVRDRRAQRGEPRPRDAARAGAPWSSPMFPYLGWIILGWVLTWAAVELEHAPAPARHRVAHRRPVGRRHRPVARRRPRSSGSTRRSSSAACVPRSRPAGSSCRRLGFRHANGAGAGLGTPRPPRSGTRAHPGVPST